MHIVLVSRLAGHGGIAVYNRTLARALVQQGHQVSVVTSSPARKRPTKIDQEGYSTHTLPVRHFAHLHQLPIVGSYVRPSEQMLYSFRVAQRLQALHREKPIDIVEFAEIGGEGFFYLRKHIRAAVVVRCHTPTFVLRQYHTAYEMPYSTSLTALMEKYCIRQADAVTSPSVDMAQIIARECRLPVEAITAIPNTLDTAQFAPDGDCAGAEKQPTAGDQELIILHTGRLERVKGIEVLIEAIPAVLRQVPQARFVFIGANRSDGAGSNWLQRLQERGQAHNVAERVDLLGYVDDQALRQWYRRADIAVVPSLNYESFSYTCAQAMAAGLPLVASRIGGIPETVDHGRCGRLVEPGDATSLAQAIIELADNEALRRQMGRAGQRRARRCFEAKIVAEQMVRLYTTTIRKTERTSAIQTAHP